MKDLITIETNSINGEPIKTVNARDLHAFLGVGKRFTTWLQDKIEQYGFVENQDYIVFPKIGRNIQGGRPSVEYAITLDMAKELSMVERNAKGKEARQYFIQCEKRVKTLDKPKTPSELIMALAELNVANERRIEAVESKLEDMENGNIPSGYQPYSYLSAHYGLTKAKCKQLVAAFNTPTKSVLHRTPDGFVSQMAVVEEDAFKTCFDSVMEDAEQGEVQWFHPALGRFTLKSR